MVAFRLCRRLAAQPIPLQRRVGCDPNFLGSVSFRGSVILAVPLGLEAVPLNFS
jgi:hypothetical protein